MKKIICISIFLSLVSFGYTQTHHDFAGKRKEIHDLKIEFLKEQLDLNEKQEKAFFTLYNELSEKLHIIHKEERASGKTLRTKALQLDDTEVEELSDKIAESRLRRAKLENDYYYKFKRILSPRKLFNLHRAERAFKRSLFQNRKMHHKP